MAPLPALLDTLATTLHPTRTLPHLLFPRQQTTTTTPAATTVTVVSTTSTSTNSDDSDPNAAKTLSGGAIAGIVIGSIAGFLLLVWIIRSCTNLGAPPGGDAVPGRPWYGSVKDEYPPRHVRGRSRGRSGSRHSHYEHYEHHGHHHGHHHHGGSRSRSRRVSVVDAVPVQEVAPVVVRDERRRSSRRRSGSRGYYGYGEGEVRGGRSRSRGGY